MLTQDQKGFPYIEFMREYFQQLEAHLRPQGLLLVNIIANPLFNDAFSKRVYNTLHQVFSFCTVIPIHWNTPRSHVIYVCAKQNPDKTIYTDNLTTATFDYFDQRIVN